MDEPAPSPTPRSALPGGPEHGGLSWGQGAAPGLTGEGGSPPAQPLTLAALVLTCT